MAQQSLYPKTQPSVGDITKKFEGYSSSIYTDTQGKKTIGYGFNLDDPTVAKLLPDDVRSGVRPIQRAEADKVFGQLYQRAYSDAVNYLGPEMFGQLSDMRKSVLVDMAYNLGSTRLGKFDKMKKAIQASDFKKARAEMIDSKWYKQVGRRGMILTNMMREGR